MAAAAYTKEALAAELRNDPAGLGYAPYVAANNDAACANLINDPTKGGMIQKSFVTANELQACVVVVEVLALTVPQQALWQAILTAAASGGVPMSDAQIRQQIDAVFTATGGGTTHAKVNQMQQRPGSRAEALWGDGMLVSTIDVGNALRN